MKVSLKWLNEYVDVPSDTQEFCDRLDLTGTGVEGLEETGAQFKKVVVGQILEKEAHPDSDHMWVCKVSVGAANTDADGSPEPLQIVCGAQNFNAGDKIPVAMIGAEFGDFKIKKSKLRGVTSYGMNCSERELGLGSNHDGIMILPADAPVGTPFAEYMKLSDKIIDLEITPNRPDCLSVEGLAREVGAMYRTDVRYPSMDLTEGEEATEDAVDVTVAEEGRCPRYTARVIRGVKVGPSPDWLVERITASGARSINNVVDVTNYILFLLGQPLHAFDFDKVKSADGKAHIVVRPAEEGEKLTTLDGQERTLTPDMTVIATPERAVALAGVMGGLDSEVTDDTVDILLEAATFDPAHTSRTSRNLGLISESSMRYERKVDAGRITRNADFAAALMAKICGGTVSRGLVDVWPVKDEPFDLQFRIPRFCAMMGADIPRADIEDILERLGCKVEDDGSNTLHVIAPTWRPDLEREIDLYEEVLRLYGMEKVPATLPGGRDRIPVKTPTQRIVEKLNRVLPACGLNETMTYSFAEPGELERLRMSEEGLGEPVELINPINAEQSQMRRSIIPGLLRSVAYNQSHGVENIQLYEVGRVFFGHEGHQLPREAQRLAGVLAGRMTEKGWNTDPAPFDFFDGKGVLESIARELALPKVRFRALEGEAAGHLQPGRAAEMLSGGSVIGWVGELHPLAVDAYDAKGPVVAFELDIDALVRSARPARDFEDIPEFPPVSVDVAFIVDGDVTNEKLMQRMHSAGGKLLSRIHLFDVYRDEKRLGAGKKSMAYSLEYRAADRTLTGEEVEKAHAKLVKKVCGGLGAEIRS
ncbi:MAG: phenylalanine--tRNA ligase subunit beta [Eggerthellaceae bacterium]|jgi:phenylalanyl-tRNA synthetase beta chain